MPKPRGYPATVFQEEDPKFLCVYCYCVLKNPIQSFCGHRFCEDCMEYLLKCENSELCPECIKEGGTSDVPSLSMEQTFTDNAIKREFNSMNASCPFENCAWSGLFKEFETHYITCEHKELECQCGTKYPISRQRQHLENECPYREVHCPNCNESILFKDLGEHNRQCLSHPKQCMICNETLPETENPTESLTKHLENDVAGHLAIMARRIGHVESIVGLTDSPYPIQESLMKRISTVENKLQSISHLQRHLPPKTASCAESQATAPDPRILPIIKTQLELYENVVAVLNREVEKLTLKMNSMQIQRRQEADQLDAKDRKVKALERALAMKDATISELSLRISALEQTSYDGKLLWRIDDFARKRQEAISGRIESIYSPPFYTSKSGYKMCARMFLNGDGHGQGTHMSLSYHVLKGLHDSLLKWPFRRKVSFALIGQNRDGEHEDVVHSIIPNPASLSFERPVNNMNRDVDSICPQFMTLSQLDNPVAGYVIDDTALVRITVSPEDIPGSNSDNDVSVENFYTDY